MVGNRAGAAWVGATVLGWSVAWALAGAFLAPEVDADPVWSFLGPLVSALFGLCGAATGWAQAALLGAGSVGRRAWTLACALGFAATHPWPAAIWMLLWSGAAAPLAGPIGNPPELTWRYLALSWLLYLPAGLALALAQWRALGRRLPRPTRWIVAVAALVALADTLGYAGGTRVHYTGYPDAHYAPMAGPLFWSGAALLIVAGLPLGLVTARLLPTRPSARRTSTEV